MDNRDPFSVRDDSSPPGASSVAGKAVEVGRVFDWLRAGWQFFMREPALWIAISVVLAIITIILGMIPLLGQIVANFLMPIFAAGLMLGCRAMEQGRPLRLDHLFAGFRDDRSNLVMLGIYYALAFIAIAAVAFVIGGGAAMGGAMMGRRSGPGVATAAFVLAMIVMIGLSIPLAMAIWFAAPLVVFRRLAPLDALKTSFRAWAKSLPAFVVNLVLLALLVFVAAIPFGLGFLVLIPVMAGMLYRAYQDVFEQGGERNALGQTTN